MYNVPQIGNIPTYIVEGFFNKRRCGPEVQSSILRDWGNVLFSEILISSAGKRGGSWGDISTWLSQPETKAVPRRTLTASPDQKDFNYALEMCKGCRGGLIGNKANKQLPIQNQLFRYLLNSDKAAGETGAGEKQFWQKSVFPREKQHPIIGYCCCMEEIWAVTQTPFCPSLEWKDFCCKEMPNLCSHCLTLKHW